MERIAKGDRSYCVTKDCPIRSQCTRAWENYIAGPDIVSSFYGQYTIEARPDNTGQVLCETFIKLED